MPLLISGILLIATLVAGCATLPTTTHLPPGITMQQVAETSATPFAADPSGTFLTYASADVRIKNCATQSEQTVLPDTQGLAAVAWSRDGKLCAVAVATPGGSRLYLFESSGKLRAATDMNELVTSLAWRSASSLLIAAVSLKHYSFGTDFQQFIFTWDGTGTPSGVRVHNATLRPGSFNALQGKLPSLFTLTSAPLGDAVLFTRVQDPPEFNTYRRIMLRYLETGTELTIANVAVDSASPRFTGTDDTLIYGDGSGTTYVRDPWQSSTHAALPYPGYTIAVSPGGRHTLIDGRLATDRTAITSLPERSQGMFAAGGSRLFVQYDSRIFMLDGLTPDAPPTPESDQLNKLLALRRLRSQGLITPADFNASVSR